MIYGGADEGCAAQPRPGRLRRREKMREGVKKNHPSGAKAQQV